MYESVVVVSEEEGRIEWAFEARTKDDRKLSNPPTHRQFDSE